MSQNYFRPFALIICVFFSATVDAQQKTFEQYVGWKTSSERVVLNSFASGNPDQFVLALSKNDSIQVSLFNHSNILLDQFRVRKNVSDKFSGGFVKGDSIALFFFEDLDIMHSWVYDTVTKKISEYRIPYNPRKEKHLANINTGTRFLHIAIRKTEPVLIVYDFNAHGNFERSEYDLSAGRLNSGLYGRDLWEKLSISQVVMREPDVATINSIEFLQPDEVSNPSKFYCKNDSLFLVINNSVNELSIFSIALDNKAATYRKLEVAKRISAQESVYNTYLYKDRLYHVYADPGVLAVSAYDFFTGKKLAQFQVTREDSIWFKNTAIIQDGGGTVYSKNAHRELEKTRQLVRKMIAGRPIISVSSNAEGQHEILVGVVKELRQVGGGFHPAGPGGIPAYSGGISDSWQRLTHFKMVTDARTEEHLPGVQPVDVMEKIEDYKKGIRSNDDAEVVINLEKGTAFFYYLKDSRKLCAVMIYR